jgi:hypothetical protein
MSGLTMSCSKDESLTDLDKIEIELSTFAQSKNITKCSIWELSNDAHYRVIEVSAFKFSNGFISVYNSIEYRYNLLYLYNYRVDNNNVLVLEFVRN